MDRYILAKLREYVEESTREHDDYDIAGACDALRKFLDVLTNWYIRRSRERFWATDGVVDQTPSTRSTPCSRWSRGWRRRCCRCSPRRSGAGSPASGRCTSPTGRPPTALPADHALVAAMDEVRDVCSAGSALRKAGGLRTRLPWRR